MQVPGPNIQPRPLRILLVEDSPILRSRLVKLLSQHVEVRVAGQASAEEEALEKLDANPYDALVVDVELRPGSGISVVRQAHAQRQSGGRGPRSIIVLTNYGLPAVKERCLQAGADHFLDKMREIDRLVPLLLGLAHEVRAAAARN